MAGKDPPEPNRLDEAVTGFAINGMANYRPVQLTLLAHAELFFR